MMWDEYSVSNFNIVLEDKVFQIPRNGGQKSGKLNSAQTMKQ